MILRVQLKAPVSLLQALESKLGKRTRSAVTRILWHLYTRDSKLRSYVDSLI